MAVGGGDIYFDSSKGPGRASIYFGLAITDFDLRIQNAGTNFDKSDNSNEAYLQFGYYHNLNESIDIGFTWAGTVGNHLTGTSEIDLKLNYAFYKQMRVNAGYRRFTYNYDHDEQDSEVEFKGPFIGLYLPF